MAMAADPHMLLAAASLVPGLGSLAAAMDMALYLYEGDSFNAALAAAALIPGGAMLAIGVGKGARALFNLARSGAKDLGAAVKASRVFRGLAGGARAVSRVVGSVRTRISRWIGKTDDVGRDVGRLADDADAWRVPGSVGETGKWRGVDYRRPYIQKATREQTWKNAIEPATGRVRDPKTGQFMSKDMPWDMGHKPGWEFSKYKDYAQETGMSWTDFKVGHNNPAHYRPELPPSNRGHLLEAPPDINYWREGG